MDFKVVVLLLKKREKNDLYCQFLIAAQKNYTVTELSSRLANNPSHDSFTKWLSSDQLTPKLLWKSMKQSVDVHSGDLILDDTIFDHFYGENIELVYPQYSSRHKKVVLGIGLVTLLWYSHYQHIPIDYRLFDPKTDGKSRNDHLLDMVKTAKLRGFKPGFVIIDSWYSSLDNLKMIDHLGWKFVAWVKGNRKVSFVKGKQQLIRDIPIPNEGCVVWLRGFGVVKIVKLVHQDQHIDYLVTNSIRLEASDILNVADRRWEVEVYHKGLKQTTGVAFCQARTARAQRNHIFCCIRVFLSLERESFTNHLSWYEVKANVIAEAISLYLRGPTISLVSI